MQEYSSKAFWNHDPYACPRGGYLIWYQHNILLIVSISHVGHNSLIDMIAFLWHSSCTMDPSFNASQSVRSDNILHVLWHGLLLYSFISLNINPPSKSLCGLAKNKYSPLRRETLVSRATKLDWRDNYWTGQILHILVDICSAFYTTFII